MNDNVLDMCFKIKVRHKRYIKLFLPGEKKKRPAYERLMIPEYISNDILQYLIE